MGQPFESPEDWAKFLASEVTPFAAQPILTGEKEFGIAAMGAELAGMRTSPITSYAKLQEMRAIYAQQDYPDIVAKYANYKAFAKDKPNLVAEMDAKHSDLKAMKEQWETDRRPRLKGERKLVDNYTQGMDTAQAIWTEEMDKAQRAYNAGQLTPSEFRERYKMAGQALRSSYELIERNPDNQAIPGIFAEWEKEGEPTPAIKVARNEYIARVYAADDLEDEWGNFNYAERERRITEFRAKWGEDMFQDVIDWLKTGRKEVPIVKAYRQTQEILKPYWELQDKVLRLFPAQTAQTLDKVAKLEKSAPSLARDLLARNPDASLAKKLIRTARDKWKKEHPQEAWLIQFWY